MSFSAEVKNELCRIRQKKCCDMAECYGMLALSRCFTKDNISLLTEHEETALRFSKLLRDCFGVDTKISLGGVKIQNMTVTVGGDEQRNKIFEVIEEQDLLNRIIYRECCASAFLRGAFLASGSIADPNKGYHMEFVCNDAEAARFLSNIARQYCSALAVAERGRTMVAYTKDSSVIEDILTFMNATGHTLEFMNVKIYKDFRNRINRERNCDTANINKTVEAALRHRAAIAKLKKSGRLSHLEEDLQLVALLRDENPDATLNELAQICDPPRNKAWVNRRLNKIEELAEEE
ncbi:MAG: DNA-binding protein WhiA [Clostridia bacterium]|nr:DNA-binding protein WhiA [Clostridia bacterium]